MWQQDWSFLHNLFTAWMAEHSEGAFCVIDLMGDNEEEGTRLLGITH